MEYDFSKMKGGVRGKYAQAMKNGYTVTVHKADGSKEIRRFSPIEDTVVLAPDVKKYFSDSEAVNQALRGLIALLPNRDR